MEWCTVLLQSFLWHCMIIAEYSIRLFSGGPIEMDKVALRTLLHSDRNVGLGTTSNHTFIPYPMDR